MAVGVAFFGFYSLLFLHFNAAPDFHGVFTANPRRDFQYYMDSCRVSVSKISISGWVAKPAVRRGKHATTAVLRDESNGRMYVMKTDLPPRRDVTAHLNQVLGDAVNYDNTGFSASLNLSATGRGIREGRVYVAYDEGQSYSLVPMPCAFSSRR